MVPGTPPASCPHPSACIMGEYRSLAARGFCFHCCVAYARSGSVSRRMDISAITA